VIIGAALGDNGCKTGGRIRWRADGEWVDRWVTAFRPGFTIGAGEVGRATGRHSKIRGPLWGQELSAKSSHEQMPLLESAVGTTTVRGDL